jgi:uncharacterized protein YukE
MHDRIAELAGLRAELATCKNGPRESWRDKAGEVQAEIDRVRGELDEAAEALETESTTLADSGQDVRAAEAAVQARRIRAVLAEAEYSEARTPLPKRSKRTAQAAKAPETTDGGGS